MLLGVPPVATKVGECPFLIEDGEDGFLYDYDDEAEGARLVLRVIEDDELRTAMAQRARNKILSRYGTRAMVDATVEAYNRVLGQGVDLPAPAPHSL